MILGYANSSNGTITFDTSTGQVTDIQDTSPDKCISNIIKFDIEEWRKYYGKQGPEFIFFDILDLTPKNI